MQNLGLWEKKAKIVEKAKLECVPKCRFPRNRQLRLKKDMQKVIEGDSFGYNVTSKTACLNCGRIAIHKYFELEENGGWN